MSKNIKISLLLIVLFMTAVQFLFINKLTTPRYLSAPELLVNGFYLFPESKAFSDFTLVTANNKTINQNDLIGKWTLMYFGFTLCPDECPVAMSLIRNLYATLEKKDFDLSDKQTILVTIDPENDSPEIVDKYAKAFNQNFIGARSNRPMLLSLATQLNVMVIEPPITHEAHSIDHLENHTNNILLIDPQGKFFGFFRPPFDEEKFLLTYQSVVTPR
ncbi:SCO family protein [Gammaproteobacteria bacterium]|jgi:protein SCO1/2|nr:SCO family protein [Gammaproteobacteria bacterium]|tara:strand:- start:5691 stop:6341 length:651 start_codon:yes stop_codon:yes gene_type:complete